MAASNGTSPVVKQIDKQFLKCGICLERYRTPKVLPCLHTFCQKCLQNYIPPHSLSLSCPICRQTSILPEEGVSGLQNNFFITNLMEVLEGPKTNGTQSDSKALPCPSHEGEVLKFYCESCETAVCQHCTIAEHNEHSTVPLKDAVEEHKKELEELLTKAKARIAPLTHAIDLVSNTREKLSAKKTNAETDLVKSFETLDKVITTRKETLLNQLETYHSSKLKVLEEQKKKLELGLSNIINSCEFTEQALTHGNETEVLLVKKQMADRLRELSAISLSCKPEENDFIKFTCDLSSVEKCTVNTGSVQSNSAVPHESVASGEGLKRAKIGEQTVVTIITKDSKGELVKTGRALVTAHIQNPDGNLALCTIADNKNGTYDIGYSLEYEGEHALTIKLFEEHIKGSPYRVKGMKEIVSPTRPSSSKVTKTNVKQKATKRPPSTISSKSRSARSNPIEDDLLLRIGMKGRNKAEFMNPQCVACSATGRLIVTDSGNNSVQVFVNNCDFKMKFGIRGRNPGQLQRPTGCAIMANGNYLIADYDNKMVSMFTPDGKFASKIGTGRLQGPKGVSVDRNGNIIIVDNKNSQILIFNPNGKLLNRFGSRGMDESQLCGPHFTAINSNNEIIVSDFHNHCIKVFDAEGQFIMKFGSNGEGNGQFNAPTGVAVDSLDNIIVADWGNSRIQVFDSNGSFLSYINTNADPLYGPQGLAITSDGNIAVADSGNYCVKIYKYLQ
ncbi:tripartite motif-containing protein 2-like [Saccoglossus kowalevskii]|uniref:Tripartite motif-containing protein 2-like n=1 Tax=Saccoglossus kowalevskii TaxID=10224 RepID=A0ABM0GQE5_SACKO|nr:PREDICTED: tripartite motif-containing protein 2-like [Saccoglossus kowalevskii]